MKSKTFKPIALDAKCIQPRIPKDYPWKVLRAIALDLAGMIDAHQLKELSDIIRNRDIEGYLEWADHWVYQCTTTQQGSLAEKRAIYQLACGLKKFQFETSKEDRVNTAKKKFLGMETRCAMYNEKWCKEFFWGETDWAVNIFTYARGFLQKLLGDSLPGWGQLSLSSRHGPGSSLGMRCGQTDIYYKYSEWPYTVTHDAFRFARFAIETDPRWFGALQNSYRERMGIPMHFPLDMKRFWTDVFTVVDGNRIEFVPKNARTERSIAIEPTLNLYLQLGVDGFIRRRLKRWGVDLDSQLKNQQLAWRGSVAGNLATIDLEGASDSVSLKLCELLLPGPWYDYLVAIRSPKGVMGNEIINYEKISSMGNGYTFVLESALFTALVYAVARADHIAFGGLEFSVYGDDIIIPVTLYYKVVEALRLAGFTCNLEKTFNSGPFRESCGTDWFQGNPIRPVFLTSMPETILDLFTDFNRMKRFLELNFCIDSEESKVCTLIEQWIPIDFRIYGPYSDESFDAYIHSKKGLPPYKDGLYVHPRFVIRPRPQKGPNFLFRKLMANLSGEPIPSDFVKRRIRISNRFTVTHRKMLSVGKVYSPVNYWQDSYSYGPNTSIA